MEDEKLCFYCKATKPLSDFYGRPTPEDGRRCKCKECIKIGVRKNYKANQDYYKKYESSRVRDPKRMAMRRAYQKTEEGKKRHQAALRAYYLKNPEAKAAHGAVRREIKAGRMVRGCCVICGTPGAEAHHPDYSKKLDVIWLCMIHHKEHHWKTGGEHWTL